MEQGSVLRLAGQFGVQLRHVGLNPFGTGQCLTTNGLTTIWNGETMSQSLWNRAVSYDNSRSFCFSFCNVSIPLEQGSVLRQIASNLGEGETRLNPFGTGQCLTTNIPEGESLDLFRLNPFGTGQCLTTKSRERGNSPNLLSQSLWNRAVSYDCSGVIKPCATRLTEATSQLFPRLRELGLDLAKF